MVVNARIPTGLAHRPWADAIAIAGRRIVAAGSGAEVRKLGGSQARVVNARALQFVPGRLAEWEDAGRPLPSDGTREPGRALPPGSVADFLLVDTTIPGHPAINLAVEGGQIVRESIPAQGDSP